MSGELRLPTRLISMALTSKKIKLLRLFALAKMQGHRVEIGPFLRGLKIHPTTGKRYINELINLGWAGGDGKYLFLRSWKKLGFRKRGGLYLTNIPKCIKKFEVICFSMALKKIYRKPGSQHSHKRRVEQNDYPARYLCKALGLSERRFERLKARAQKYRFISVKRVYTPIGKSKDFSALKRNLHGVPIFVRGKHTVVPEVSKIRVLI